ncbi:MAG: hypothetical protein LV473_06505 [Nitrospira sp.]|nr:hypothetical protein [Nitrospira sp.]
MGTLAAGFFVLVLIGMMLSADWAVAFLWPDIWARVAADHRTSTVLAAYQAIRAQQDSDPSMALGRYLDWLMSAETQSWSEHFLSIILPIAAVGTVVGLGIFILIGWFLFRFIITLYTRKRYTDQMLMILGGWIFFAVAMIPLNTSVSLFVNLAAIATVASLIRFGWRSLPRPQNPCVRLLLLRSFTLGERSDRLFQELASLWRSIGSLQLVGAVDLALSTLEPHEVLDFMRGRSGRQFVHRQAAVDDRLALFDYERDLDGRFRSNVIYCVGDVIWQYTVNRLIENSDCVLMDVRGFTRYRSGCLFEIRCLAKADDCHRITFLVDEVTDRSFLEETWFAAAKTSSVEGTSVVRRLRFVSEQPNDGSISQRIIASYCT